MNMKKILLILCALTLIVGSVFGTLAYFTDSETETNTFTVGRVKIKLDEAKVNPDGTPVENAPRVTENEYHLLPGFTYTKDPTVTVLKGSEDAYVRMLVKVENMDKLMAAMPKSDFADFYNEDLFLLQMLCNGWDSAKWNYAGYDDGVYEFRYFKAVPKSTTETKLEPLFQSITVPGKVDNEGIAHLKDVEIHVAAHAIQTASFTNAAAAWTAFDTQNP